MSSADSLLPPGFEALQPYVGLWAVPGTAERARRRLQSTEAERVSFYNAAKDLLPAALEQLDRKPLQEFNDQETRLMDLLLSFCHIALAVEVQGEAEAEQAQSRKHMRIVRSSADIKP
jgi:hypothetical protein